MPNLLIRNVPPELHARLKASAASHRRSLTQETILIMEQGLAAGSAETFPKPLPEPFKPRRPITMEETLRFMDEGQR
jgi:plasmid stability protein